MKGDGAAAAARLIVRHRNEIINREQWPRLDQWLRRLPAEVVERDPELLMLQAWHLQNHGRHPESYATLDRIEPLIDAGAQKSCDPERLRGGVDALRSQQRYHEGNGDLAREHAERALKRLPPDCMSERAFALLILGGALQMCGDLEGARKLSYNLLADTSVPRGIFQARLLATLCFVHWIAADLPALRLAANQYFELGEELDLGESTAVGRYFLGIVQYNRNELSKAETSLLPILAERKVANLEYFAESAFTLASVYHAGGHADKARVTVESVCEHLLRSQNTTVLQRAQAYQADLALRQGRMAEALRWAQRFDPEPFQAMFRFFDPAQTLAKVLVAEGSAESLERAGILLTRLEAFLEGIHNTRFLIEVFALQALLRDARGDESAARDVLDKAISLAQPSGFVRLFVDLDPELAKLLNRLDVDEEGLRYVGRILAAFRGDGEPKPGNSPEQPVQMKGSAGGQPWLDPLTKRELEVLTLLAKHLSNKEIAAQLHISAGTVKRHTNTLYEKLGVHSRREAVAKAAGLGILDAG